MKLDTDLIPKMLGRAQDCAGDWAAENAAVLARKQFGALLDYAKAAESALRKVAEMQCTQSRHNRYMKVADCREREAVVMGGKIPPEEQRRGWCPRCVAADALESLPE